MTWSKAIQREVIEEFIEAARFRGTAQTTRDERRPRVKLDPFVPAESPTPAIDVEARPLQVDPDDEPVEYGDRKVVVEVAPIRRRERPRDIGAPRYRPPRPPPRRRA